METAQAKDLRLRFSGLQKAPKSGIVNSENIRLGEEKT
jgi:hypothetical protein